MEKFEKIYIPTFIKEAAKDGVVLIATGKCTISNEGIKMEMIHQHLNEKANVIVTNQDELLKLLSEFGNKSKLDAVQFLIDNFGRREYDEKYK